MYVSNGQVLNGRSWSPWKLSFFGELFWSAVEFIGLFFQTIFQPDLSRDRRNTGSSRFSDGRGPPGYPGGRRRMGRINHGGGPNPPPTTGMGGG